MIRNKIFHHETNRQNKLFEIASVLGASDTGQAIHHITIV